MEGERVREGDKDKERKREFENLIILGNSNYD